MVGARTRESVEQHDADRSITFVKPLSPRETTPSSSDERLFGVAVSRIGLKQAPMAPSREESLTASQ